MNPIAFLWRASRGTRLRPWRSAYLRWRVETFTGVPADEVGAGTFVRLAWDQRRQMLRFARWLAEMAALSREGRLPSGRVQEKS